MTSIDRLDADLDRWEQELAFLEQSTVTPAAPGLSSIISKLNKLGEQQRGLQEMVDHCRLAEATEVPMSPSSRAILYWAREWADRVDNFRLCYADYLDKLLWLNLLRGRLLGRKNPFCLDISDVDVQQVLQKKQSLERTEEVLQNELKVLQKRELQMRAQYDRFQFEDSSRQAAQSFGSTTWTLSNQRPIFEAFGGLLRTLAAHMHHSRPQVKKIQQLAVNFTRRSQILMEQCSRLLRQDSDSFGSQKNRKSRLIQESLMEMKCLELEIETTLASLNPVAVNRGSPLRLKNPIRKSSAYLERPIDRERTIVP